MQNGFPFWNCNRLHNKNEVKTGQNLPGFKKKTKRSEGNKAYNEVRWNTYATWISADVNNMTCFLLVFNGHDHRAAIVNIVENAARCSISVCCRSAHCDIERDAWPAGHQFHAVRSVAVTIQMPRGKYHCVGRPLRGRWSLFLLYRCRSPCLRSPIPSYQVVEGLRPY